MFYPSKTIPLKDGRTALLRGTSREDAAEMLEYMKTCCAQTPFLLRYPDEVTMSIEQEGDFLEQASSSPNSLMIVCEVEGAIAGNCQLNFHNKRKTRHRADVAIALLQEYWGLGIGTALFGEMIEAALQHGSTQLELEVIEGNERAMRLYQKMGFEIVGTRPDAIHLDTGERLKEFIMINSL